MDDLIRRSDVIGLLEDMFLFGEYDIIASSFSKADEEKAHMAINDIPAVNRWIPVEDALPDTDGEYLVYTNRYEIVEYDTELREFGYTDEYKDELGYTVTEWYETHNVTYWMPKPEPPDKE